MATLVIYEPDYNLIKLAPANISLPLPLMENVSNDDDRNNKTKKSSKKTGNKKKEEKKCIFGRAGITTKITITITITIINIITINKYY